MQKDTTRAGRSIDRAAYPDIPRYIVDIGRAARARAHTASFVLSNRYSIFTGTAVDVS